MKTLIIALFLAMTMTVTAQVDTDKTEPSFNDKSDIVVAYQFLSKDVNTRDTSTVTFDRSRDEHGVNIGYTYYFGNKNLGLTSELGVNLGENSTSTVTYLSGATLKKRTGKFQPFATALVGFGRERANEYQLRFPRAKDADAGFAFSTGAGVDYKISKNTAIRVIRVDYLQTRIFGATNHNLRLGTGIVF